jgi:two-component system cell cycle response regulator DivK
MVSRPAASAKKVLIVEDDALHLKLLHNVLEYHGYRVLATGSGAAAIEIAQRQQPDLILMDIQLPDITGIEATRLLKADAQTQRIPIIAVTGFAMRGERALIMESGCDDYVAKPFNFIEFLKLVARYTERDVLG